MSTASLNTHVERTVEEDRRQAFHQTVVRSGSLTAAARDELLRTGDAPFVASAIVEERPLAMFSDTKTRVMQSLGTPDADGRFRVNANVLQTALKISLQNIGLEEARKRGALLSLAAKRERDLAGEIEETQSRLLEGGHSSEFRDFLLAELSSCEAIRSDLRQQVLLVSEAEAVRDAINPEEPDQSLDRALSAGETLRRGYLPRLEAGHSIGHTFASRIAQERTALPPGESATETPGPEKRPGRKVGRPARQQS
jgi:hypothetical protein